MSVSAELLCSFELLKPLDSSALKSHIKKGRNKRQSMLNSPVSILCQTLDSSEFEISLTFSLAGKSVPTELPRMNMELHEHVLESAQCSFLFPVDYSSIVYSLCFWPGHRVGRVFEVLLLELECSVDTAPIFRWPARFSVF
jgi:hypothetical protein